MTAHLNKVEVEITTVGAGPYTMGAATLGNQVPSSAAGYAAGVSCAYSVDTVDATGVPTGTFEALNPI